MSKISLLRTFIKVVEIKKELFDMDVVSMNTDDYLKWNHRVNRLSVFSRKLLEKI